MLGVFILGQQLFGDCKIRIKCDHSPNTRHNHLKITFSPILLLSALKVVEFFLSVKAWFVMPKL